MFKDILQMGSTTFNPKILFNFWNNEPILHFWINETFGKTNRRNDEPSDSEYRIFGITLQMFGLTTPISFSDLTNLQVYEMCLVRNNEPWE